MDPAILAKPAATPPPGVIPNYDDPPNRNASSLAFIIVCLTLTTIFFCIKIYSKLVVLKKIAVEDVLSFMAYGLYIGMVWVGFSLWKKIGFFVHQYNCTIGQVFDLVYITYFIPLFYAITMTTIKTAILLEWIRIFVPPYTRNWFFWTSWVLIVLTSIFYIGCVIGLQFYCSPVEKNYHRWVPGTCHDRRPLDIIPAAFNMVFDILILLLAQHIIWNLQMNMRRKIGISIIFSVGLLACVAAVARIVYTAKMRYQTDLTYDVIPAYFGALGECTCAILVFTVPSVPKVFKESSLIKSMSSWVSTRTRSSKNTSSGGSNMSSKLRNPASSVQSLKTYQMMPDTESAIPLDEYQYDPSAKYGVGKAVRHTQTEILRTTDVRTEVIQGGQVRNNEWYRNTQPWEEHSYNSRHQERFA